MNTPSKIFLILVSAIMLIGLAAFVPVRAQTVVCAEWHVVRRGETLKSIAQKYGVSVQELLYLNRVRNPYHK